MLGALNARVSSRRRAFALILWVRDAAVGQEWWCDPLKVELRRAADRAITCVYPRCTGADQLPLWRC